ncbi:MAG: transcriptional repressor [Bacteroidia bacterium]|nr:transcriptional repressor [Bacteroidia bacterium]MDW8133741.1 transcriptional repressor [Bacteroidia bacterium]
MSSYLEQAKAILEAYLTQKGLRRTEERYKILKAIYEDLTHFDADSLYHHLLKGGYRLSRATVYNTLELLLACGLIKRYTFGEGSTVYERSLGRRQHDHLICLDCGFIQEFCDPQMAYVVEGVGRLFQMKPVQHELIVYAHCLADSCPNRRETYTFVQE